MSVDLTLATPAPDAARHRRPAMIGDTVTIAAGVSARRKGPFAGLADRLGAAPFGLIFLGIAGASLALPASDPGAAVLRPAIATLFGFFGGLVLWLAMAPYRRRQTEIDPEAGTLTVMERDATGRLIRRTERPLSRVRSVELKPTLPGEAKLTANLAGGEDAPLLLAEGPADALGMHRRILEALLKA